MKITITRFDDMSVTPKYGNYTTEVVLDGVSAEELIENLQPTELQELLRAIPIDEMSRFVAENIADE